MILNTNIQFIQLAPYKKLIRFWEYLCFAKCVVSTINECTMVVLEVDSYLKDVKSKKSSQEYYED